MFIFVLFVAFMLCSGHSALTKELGSPNQTQCNAKSFDEDSFVCVCDENYCDSFIIEEFPAFGQYLLITSDKNEKRFSTETRNTEPLSNYNLEQQCFAILTDRTVYLTLNRAQKEQTILGFGGAFTDAVGYNLNKVSEGLIDQVFKAYFAQDGLKYNLARNTIAHSDFSLSEYYYDDTDYDYNMTDFKLAEDDYLYRIPYIKKAKSMVEEDLLLFSSLWTCPAWMRGNNDNDQRIKVLEKYFESFCLYIMKYLEAYNEEGLEHYGVAFANEPTISLGIIARPNLSLAITDWTLERMINFAENHFIPALAEKFPETKMLFLDDNRGSLIATWLRVLSRHTSFSSKLELAGFHSYFNRFIDNSVLDSFHENHPNVTIITSELSTGSAGHFGLWSYAEYYATVMLEEMNHHTSGWLDWNLVLDTESQPTFTNTPDNAPIIVDVEKNIFYKQPSYYAIGHFSKFMPRGSVKIGLESQFPTDLEYVCVERPDGFLVAVLQNKSNKTVTVNIVNGESILNIPAGPYSINTVFFS